MGLSLTPAEERAFLAFGAWRPPPTLSVSEWAGTYRYLSPEASAEPGLWNNARAPHLVEPMDHLGPYSETDRVVCKFSAQTGKTEILLNFIGYVMDCDPGPILCVQPNVTPMGEAFSKDRVATMLRDSPTLAAKVGPDRARTSASTITHKVFAGGHLTIAGANSPAGLASRPIRYFAADELDCWELIRAGDSLTLGRKRQQTFRARRSAKELIVSTPTYADFGISVEYAKCDTQKQWELTCLHCGESQFPELKHFQHDGDTRKLRYVCGHCGAEHALEDEDAVKATGHWVTVQQGEEKSVGYWMSQWSSPFARWDDTAQEWIDAGDDPLKRQAVTNTVFALPWEGEGDRVDAHLLESRCEDWGDALPEGVAAITIGVDLQQDRLEAEVVGWGPGFESWSLDYQILMVDPTQPETWDELVELRKREWTGPHGKLRCTALCVDAGNWSKHVYDWVKAQHDRWVIPIKGLSAFGADPLHGSELDRRRRAVKRIHQGRPVEPLGVSQIKLTVDKLLSQPSDAAGYCHFPLGRGRDYFEQLTGERLTRSAKRGRRPQLAWMQIHDRVEARDCRTYAYAALLLSGASLECKKQTAPVQKPAPRSPQKQRYRPGEW